MLLNYQSFTLLLQKNTQSTFLIFRLKKKSNNAKNANVI